MLLLYPIRFIPKKTLYGPTSDTVIIGFLSFWSRYSIPSRELPRAPDGHFLIVLIISSFVSTASGLIHGLAFILKTEGKLFTHSAA
jgi:hypothetical protein